MDNVGDTAGDVVDTVEGTVDYVAGTVDDTVGTVHEVVSDVGNSEDPTMGAPPPAPPTDPDPAPGDDPTQGGGNGHTPGPRTRCRTASRRHPAALGADARHRGRGARDLGRFGHLGVRRHHW